MTSQKSRSTLYGCANDLGWDKAGGVYREYRNFDTPGYPLGLPARDEGRLVLQDNCCSINAQPIYQAFLAPVSPVNMLDESQPALPTPLGKADARAQNKMMQTIRRVGIIFAHAMVDENRDIQSIREPDRGIEDGVVVSPQSLLKPAKHITTIFSGQPVVHGSDA